MATTLLSPSNLGCMNAMKTLALLLPLILSGCASLADHKPPMPVSLSDSAALEAPQIAALQLDSAAEAIVSQALKRSPDLEKISARLVQAKADVGIARSTLFPTLSAATGSTRTRNKIDNAPPSSNNVNFNTREETTLSFRWELDIFGANRAARKASLYELDAATLELQAARIKLANTVRTEIVNYRAEYQREILAKKLIENLQDNLRMELALEAAGIRSNINLNDLRSELQSSIANYHLLAIESRIAPLKLRTLTDIDLETLGSLTQQATPACIPPLATEVPLAWLRQRMDVRIAEARLFSALASAQSAQASLWPNLSISADANKTRTDAGGLLGVISKGTDAFVLTQLAATLFDGGRRRSQRDRARAEADIAASEFKSVVLMAAEETESALIAHQLRQSAAAENQSASDAAYASYSSTRLRHQAGIDSQLILRRSEQQMLERKLESIASSRDQCVAAINLNRAIAFGEHSSP
jgi:NodT family efflux transporter outer membrane factor (OMF) lipoprotein